MSRGRTALLLAVLVAIEAAGVLVGAYLWASYHNTLQQNGRWSATKTRLERRVVGSGAFFSSRQTLSGERLDLGRWFGNQEVLLREPLPVRELELDFRLAPEAWLAVLFGERPDGAAGVRIGDDERFPDGWFTVAESGEFGTFEPLAVDGPPVERWVRLALRLDVEGFALSLDGGPETRVAVPLPELHSIGFRNGQEAVWIDDVVARDASGRTLLSESFFDASGFLRALAALGVAALALDLVLWRLLRRGLLTPRAAAVGLGAAAALFVLALAALALWRTRWSKTYPAPDAEKEERFLRDEVARVRREIRESFDPLPADGVVRVLAIGTSQTWGAGALREDEGWVDVLEDVLNAEAPPGRRWECLNAGVSGLDSRRLLEVYEEEWLALEPDVLVLDLSNNDDDPEAFARSLRGFARLGAEDGVATLFVLEANSIELRPRELPLHATMRRVAGEEGVPVVDLHALLRPDHARGFLWWDMVHPTSFGHRRVAEILAPHVRELVREP